jgi:hypothetical protein
VVPLPTSTLTAGTPFVNLRRRLHTSLAYLHHIPNLADFVFFLPDDCLMLRHGNWSDFFDISGNVRNYLANAFSVGLQGYNISSVLSEHFNSTSLPTGTDLHLPFFVKRCYLEEVRFVG